MTAYAYRGDLTIEKEAANDKAEAALATQRANAAVRRMDHLRAENMALKEKYNQLVKADSAKRATIGKLATQNESTQQAIQALRETIQALRKDKKYLQSRIIGLKKVRPIKHVKPTPVTEIFTYSGPQGLAAAAAEASRVSKARKAA